jgi:DNA replication protein DnaC
LAHAARQRRYRARQKKLTHQGSQATQPDDLLAGDEVLATAVLDRLLHRANLLNIKGRSYRLRDLEQVLSAAKWERLRRVSGP